MGYGGSPPHTPPPHIGGVLRNSPGVIFCRTILYSGQCFKRLVSDKTPPVFIGNQEMVFFFFLYFFFLLSVKVAIPYVPSQAHESFKALSRFPNLRDISTKGDSKDG
jgi:hypothetical protein